MATVAVLRAIASSLPEVIELPHFEKTSFRVGKMIFATMAPDSDIAMVKLSTNDQDIFCTFNRTIIYPVQNKWGQQGATYVNLELVSDEMLTELLKCAYKAAAPVKLAKLVNLGMV